MGKNSGGVRESRPAYKKSLTAGEKIASVIAEIKRNGFTRNTEPFPIGRVEERMKSFARENGVELASNSIHMTSKQIVHTFRDAKKDAGIDISEKELISFPKSRMKMDLYYNHENNTFVYTDNKSKFIIHPNYKVKSRKNKGKKVNYITASRMKDKSEFNMKKYKKI